VHVDNSPGRQKHDAGFTLIETLVALFLLVIALIPLAGIMTNVLRASVVDQVRAHAREIAASERDKAKSLTFNAIGLAGTTNTFSAANPGDQVKPESGFTGLQPGPEQQSIQNYNYTVTRDVRKSVDQYNGNTYTKKVIITVSWTNPVPAGSVTLATEIGPTTMAP